MPLQVQHSYQALAPLFYQNIAPTPVRAPQLLLWNQRLASQLQLPAYSPAQAASIFSGNQLESWMQPIAQAYSGHQFGHLSARLGDGRAILLAELSTAQQQLFDLQLKGAGPTAYSRRGDGRAALGPALREYLVSEWMAAAGVPTSRALALVQSGELVYREMALPGAVLCRVASSHLRIGTLQYAAMFGSIDELRQLADYVITRHYPAVAQLDNPYLALLAAVSQAQAQLIARWMSLGFVHGVMNTDNMTLSGETIDYGPCAFIDKFSFDARFSSIDEQGRYAYKNQPAIAQWNLARLAEALLPLIAAAENEAIALAMQVLNAFPAHYQQAYISAFSAKLALCQPDAEQATLTTIANTSTNIAADITSDTTLNNDTPSDNKLIDSLLSLLAANQLDFTDTFYQLPQWLLGEAEAPPPLRSWLTQLQQRLCAPDKATANSESAPQLLLQAAAKQMHQHNPAFIPRNHQIEQIIAAAYQGDLAPAQQFVSALDNIWQYHPQFSQLPAADFADYRTFCGT